MESAIEMSSDHATNVQTELPMYLQRPSSAKSQDATHILARTFREMFTRDFIAPETIEHLITSRCVDNEYHENYVAALQQIKEKHNRRLEEAAMLECHILQAQAQALSADEKEASRIACDLRDYPELSIPPARSHFRSCIDSDLLKKHDLISPEDFTVLRAPIVPPPKGDSEPHYLLDIKSKKKAKNVPEIIHLHSVASDDVIYHHPSESEFDQSEQKSADYSKFHPSMLGKNLWKLQISNDERMRYRAELGSLQDKVNHLKSQRFDPPGNLLIKKNRKRRKEIGIKPAPECLDNDLPVFIAEPAIVTFTDYKVGKVYEIKLVLKNVTTVMRPVRVIPPRTSFFSVSLGQFPADHGLIAPGLSCVYFVRFSPDSLCDFDDVLVVETQSCVSPLLVPLQGRRPAPILTVPEILNVGHCLMGGIKVGQFVVKNEGGPGRFCILPACCWPSGNYMCNSCTSVVKIDPFEVKPSTFELNAGQMTILEVLFAPNTLDSFTESLVIVCDNCNVRRLIVTGEARDPCVELVSVEDYLSDYEIGEMADITAQHLIRFPTLVPFIYLQETITVKNCIKVEIAYNWVIVRPHHVVKPQPEEDGSNCAAVIPTERVQDVESAFSIEPSSGVLPSEGTVQFTLTYAPPSAMEYNSVLHLVLRYFLRNSSNDDSDSRDNEMVTSKSLMTSYVEPTLTEVTTLEIEVKGKCEPYQVFVEPCIMSIPGQIIVATTLKKSFKMSNRSMASVMFTWINVQTCAYILHIEPTCGEIMPCSEISLELSITGSEPGRINCQIECRLSPVDETLQLQVMAEIKGPELIIAQPDVNFGLVQLGSCAQSALTLRNFSRVPACWQIHEVGNTCDVESEFSFCPASGEVKPLDSDVIGITFHPKCCRSVKSIFEICSCEGHGFRCSVPVFAEVQKPSVCLSPNKLHICDAFKGAPVVQTIVLANQTLFETPFKFCQVQGEHTDDFELTVKPSEGILQAKQIVEVSISFKSDKLGEFSGLMLPCSIDGTDRLLCLELSAVVRELSVSYSVSDNPEGNNRQHDPLVVDFGMDNTIGDTPKRFLFIKNNSGMKTSFKIDCEHYQAPLTPTTPSEKVHQSGICKSHKKLLLAKTQNLADPFPKTEEQHYSDWCRSMLQSGKGAAFSICPLSGTLEPFAEVVVEITGFSDMWGTYTDRLICSVDSLELFYIPVCMTVSGCPLYFTMINPKTDQKPIFRFGTRVASASPVVRPARIMNTSPVDVRLDWQTYNNIPNDDKFLDLVVSFGDPFPLKDKSGKEIQEAQMSESEVLPLDQENSEQNEIKCPKVISLRLRCHDGIASPKPFEICPSQFSVPAFGSKSVDIVFSPEAVNMCADDAEEISCISYALGYMSLDIKDRCVENHLCRLHQYDVEHLRVDMVAAISRGLLTVEYEEDADEPQYHVLASDLLSDCNKLLPLYTKVSRMTLCNWTNVSLEFHLQTVAPFSIVDLGGKMRNSVKKLNKTDVILLKPHQNIRVSIAFLLTPDLLLVNSVGDEFTESASERICKFQRELLVEFTHNAVQKIPLCASLVLPAFELSKEWVDFGTCFVGQRREIQVMLSNTTSSKSFWKCSEDNSDHTSSSVAVFEIIPNSGRLDGQKSLTSDNFVIISIFFTAQKAEDYEAVFLFEGLLGEQLQRLNVKGSGSLDGRYEAFVNI